ncbi:MAG: phosphohydrolase, partial [Deinococcales bacterium]
MQRDRLKLNVHVGQESHLQRSGTDTEYISPSIEYATPRVKLIQEADNAIRRDLEPYPRALLGYELLTKDEEALANWDMANFITVRKLGYNDHGRVHAFVTGAASLALLELLLEAGVRGDVLESGSG